MNVIVLIGFKYKYNHIILFFCFLSYFLNMRLIIREDYEEVSEFVGKEGLNDLFNKDEYKND